MTWFKVVNSGLDIKKNVKIIEDFELEYLKNNAPKTMSLLKNKIITSTFPNNFDYTNEFLSDKEVFFIHLPSSILNLIPSFINKYNPMECNKPNINKLFVCAGDKEII
ncbi:MAG: hypothetical protein MUO34_14150 [Ignavibacteriaceae bacterium]|nr:hypothetical protein [Ignavibacteriaceae bacterium]